MLSPRWRKVLMDLWGNKLRSVLVVLSIAVGVFAVGMIATVDEILTTDMNAAWGRTNPAHAVFYSDLFDDELVQTVANMPGVVQAEGRRTLSLRFSVAPGQWKPIDITVVPDKGETQVNKVYPVDGIWPPPRREILIERASLPFAHKQVGDILVVETQQEKLRELRIAGLVHDMNQNPPMFVGRAYGYITFSTLEWLGYPRGYSQLMIRVSPEHAVSQEAVQQIADQVQQKLERGGLTVYWTWVPKPNEHPIDDILQPMALILGTLGLLSLLLSGFLVVNTVSAVITQQIRQIGIMKTVGARNHQIAGMYFSLVLAFSLLALLIGIPLGAVGGQAVGKYMAGLINFDVESKGIPPGVLMLEIAVGLLVPFGAALWPVWNGARITVREALSQQGIGKGSYGSHFIDRLLERVRVLSRPVLLSLRNTFRRKGRLALTLATLSMAGAIFIAVLTVHTSLTRTLDDALQYWNYDIEIQFNRRYRIPQLVEATMQVPGVARAECWLYNSARRVRPDGREGESISLIAPPIPTSMLTPQILHGRWLLPEDENALVLNTDVLKEEPDVDVGSTIVLKLHDRESEWRVVGIVRGLLTGPIAYANYNYAATVTRGVGRAGSVMVVGTQNDPSFQTRLAKSLEAQLKAAGFQVRSSQTTADLRSMIQSQFNIIVVFLLIMAVLLAVVGGLGLMGTMSINVLERTREIGVMRAIGASNVAVTLVFLTEGVFIGLVSWVIGGALSVPLSKFLSDIVGTSMLRAPLSYTFSVDGTVLWLALVAVLAAVASLLPAIRAAKMTVRDVLAYE